MSFNLVSEPWIQVQTNDGPDTLSLREVFEQTDRVRTITGEVPTMGFAILRLLLAICHDAIGWRGTNDLNRLSREGLDTGAVLTYLDEWSERFDLFHPERPFMQVADLKTAKNEHSGLEKLIADVPNGAPFFTTRSGRGLAVISAAEAARWLVHVQSFDPSGIRSGAVGDDQSKGGKGYPIGPSWAGQTGGIVLHGTHLGETLVNNLTVSAGADDRPVWSLPQRQTAARSEDVLPIGPVQTFTWQSRRVRLVGDRSGVHGLVLAQGDKVTPQVMFGREPMTGWRYSKPQSKKFDRDVYMPNLHEAGRSLWRGLPAIIAARQELVEDRGGKHERYREPATVTETDRRESNVVVQAIGIAYGPQNATIEEIIDDRLELNSTLLSDDGLAMRITVKDAVGNAEACVRALGQLAANIARAAGEKGDNAGEGARQRVMEQAWVALDAPARRWVGSLDVNSDPLVEQTTWQQLVRDRVTGLANSVMTAAGPAAIKGRETSFGYLTAHKAYSYFLRDLHKELSLLTPTTKERS